MLGVTFAAMLLGTVPQCAGNVRLPNPLKRLVLAMFAVVILGPYMPPLGSGLN